MEAGTYPDKAQHFVLSQKNVMIKRVFKKGNPRGKRVGLHRIKKKKTREKPFQDKADMRIMRKLQRAIHEESDDLYIKNNILIQKYLIDRLPCNPSTLWTKS